MDGCVWFCGLRKLGKCETVGQGKMKSIKICGCTVLVLILFAFLYQPRIHVLTLANGGIIRTSPAPFLKSLLTETSCKITYQPKNGEVETIILLEDSDGHPAMIIPSEDNKAFFCLYYADVRYRLMKIVPATKPGPLSKNNYLGFIVLSSTCYIEQASTNDWQKLAEYLSTVPATIFRKQSIGFQRDVLISEVDREMSNIKQGFTN
jgi:hypothetical protein